MKRQTLLKRLALLKRRRVFSGNYKEKIHSDSGLSHLTSDEQKTLQKTNVPTKTSDTSRKRKIVKALHLL